MNIDIKISSLVTSDLDEITSLARAVSELHIIPLMKNHEKKVMREARDRDLLLLVGSEKFTTLKAVYNGNIVGFITWKNSNFISMLYVHFTWQRKGIGTKLLNEAVKNIRCSSVELVSSRNAIEFYKKYGFEFTVINQQSIDVIPMKYECGCDGLFKYEKQGLSYEK